MKYSILLCDFWNVLLLPTPTTHALNLELITFLSAKLEGIDKYIVTASSQASLEQYQARLIPPFETQVFTTEQLKQSKSDPQLYLHIAHTLTTLPQNILFVDDSASNISAATLAGLATHQYSTNPELFRYLSHRLL